MKRYYKVYSSREYWATLRKLHEEGYTWGSKTSLLSRKCGGFGFPHALVADDERKTVWKDEIRHCPDPSDRRLEATHLAIGDKVVLTDRYMEAANHVGEVFEITKLLMIGQTQCAFLSPSGLGAYACDGLRRVKEEKNP